jgi:hypothetical protein
MRPRSWSGWPTASLTSQGQSFAAAFYRAIASAQPIQAGLDQGGLAVELLGGGGGGKPQLLTLADVDASNIVLVKPQGI